jgi:hypothetical protein
MRNDEDLRNRAAGAECESSLASEVVRKACAAMFGRPLVTNVYRSVLVEAIVAMALKDWEWVSADYAPYDFRHPNGTRIEVKQTAVKQSWASIIPSKSSWDIKERTGYWEDGIRWIPQIGRNADIYVLALHEATDQSADHRDPAQWTFFVLPTSMLPPTQRLSLSRARTMTEPKAVHHLADAVERCMSTLVKTREPSAR